MTISILCDIIDPEAVVIGGIFMRSDDLLADGILETMKRALGARKRGRHSDCTDHLRKL